MIKKFCIVILLLIHQMGHAQVYTEKQSRHRFAQLTLGLDLQAESGGTSRYFNAQGNITSLDIGSSFSPRFLIGGTHFWGHADFYIAVPLYDRIFEKENQQIMSNRGVETAFKYYPFRIENNKLRPFIGASLSTFYFKQINNNLAFPEGPELNLTRFPLLAGITYNTKNHLFGLNLSWNYDNGNEYYISRSHTAAIDIPPMFASFSYKYMLETTLSAEKNWESGKTKQVTNDLAEKGELNGFYLGVGISSVFWLDQGSYNQYNRPYIGRYDNALIPDFTLGYYLHRLDLNIGIGYRGYRASMNTYGVFQNLARRSYLFEVTKYLFDYHGFVPFLGPVISLENLSFEEQFQGQSTLDLKNNKFGYGLTFGWDIRPNRIQSWILRTNLRWYPNLSLELAPNSEISFNSLEFNFIQLIIYPGRIIR